ncbi:type II toxin-antitoxin system ParD family antitoxin [Polymorphobacter sp. PAMC 29334]|uniref:type II toxin-antitoxin system ParD family antitoxin n=1 Tax=Polymorphobacter sp. PAMC 29334 TaxID=2862331 RepID=UPI001C763D44|nr:type II toxin-antitoxin system ParD family antitoxin [Polymorphobacter sp. PAMC 29334]QYE34382.1 type II toxin-antitoxin system ParD family antitoxin [Polymorphobacter sp. PAMC 29334]
MGSVQKISIALTDELATDVQHAVASGDYATTSEVIRDALRHWKHAREIRAAKLADLRAAWAEGIASGGLEPLDPEKIKAAGRARMNKETTIAIPADPDDLGDFDVSVASVERGHVARALRMLRARLGLTKDDFAARYAMPAEEYAGYESGFERPPEAVLAYLRVIVAEPEMTAGVAERAAEWVAERAT